MKNAIMNFEFLAWLTAPLFDHILYIDQRPSLSLEPIKLADIAVHKRPYQPGAHVEHRILSGFDALLS